MDRYREKRRHPRRDRDKETHRERDLERTPSDDEDLLDLRELGVEDITEEDYLWVAFLTRPPNSFDLAGLLAGETGDSAEEGISLRSAEFRYWLKDSRGKVSRRVRRHVRLC
jgi:hypothetical protein